MSDDGGLWDYEYEDLVPPPSNQDNGEDEEVIIVSSQEGAHRKRGGRPPVRRQDKPAKRRLLKEVRVLVGIKCGSGHVKDTCKHNTCEHNTFLQSGMQTTSRQTCRPDSYMAHSIAGCCCCTYHHQTAQKRTACSMDECACKARARVTCNVCTQNASTHERTLTLVSSGSKPPTQPRIGAADR